MASGLCCLCGDYFAASSECEDLPATEFWNLATIDLCYAHLCLYLNLFNLGLERVSIPLAIRDVCESGQC